MTDDEIAQLLTVALSPVVVPPDAEARLRHLEDQRAITDLLLTYGWLEDASRWDELLDLCTDDIVRVLAGSLVEEIQGKDALRAVLVAPVMPRRSGEGRAPDAEQIRRYEVRHLIHPPVIRIDRDRATVVASYALAVTSGDTDAFRRGVHEGGYVFDLVRRHEGWRIERMLIITENARNPLFNANR